MDRSSLKDLVIPLAEAGPFALLVLAGVACSNPAVAAAAGIGANLVAPLVGEAWQLCCRGWMGEHGVRDRPLAEALRRALERTVDRLEDEWWQTGPGSTELRRTEFRGDRSSKDIFKRIAANVTGVFEEDRLASISEDPDLLARLDRGATDAQEIVNDFLTNGMDERAHPALVGFLRANLAQELACQFDRIIYGEAKTSTAAWRAFQRLLGDTTRDMVASLAAGQTKLQNTLERLAEELQRQQDRPQEEREGELRAALVYIGDRLENVVIREGDRVVAEVDEILNQKLAPMLAALDKLLEKKSAAAWSVVGISGQRDPRSLAAPDQRSVQANVGQVRPWIFEVPHRWNPHFIGRRELLDRLAADFAAESGPATLVQVIQGLGGVGKTQLAVRFAYEHAGDYDGVWWVRAGTLASLTTDYARLARRLDLPMADNPDQAAVTAAVVAHLEGTATTGERWLLVFDNAVPRFAEANGEEEALASYLPRRGRCDVLITSRERAWTHLADPLDVDVLPLKDASHFLLERTGQDDEVAAQQLAIELDRLPLALEQAGAYVAEKRGFTKLADYLALFRRQPLDRLQLDRARTGEYEERVATTWLISFAEVERRSPAAADLLRLCGFLAPDSIPLDDLIAHAGALPERLASALRDPADAVEAVDVLLRLSLTEAGEQRTLNVHRLVQFVVRASLTAAEEPIWTGAAVRIVHDAFPGMPSDARTWPECARLLSHSLAAAGYAEALVLEPSATSGLLNHVGIYLYVRAQFGLARETIERALAITETAYGPDHTEVATVLNNLASILQTQGDFAGARSRFERALAIAEAAFGPDHPALLAGLNNLALVFWELGDLAGACTLLERALAIGDRTLGPDHRNIVITLNSLAGVLWKQGELAGAQTLLERVLSVHVTKLGPDHPSVATVLANLAAVLQARGDLAGARARFERALAIHEATLGPSHPGAATDLNNLATVLRDQGDLAGARVLLERALAIFNETLGPVHPNVATYLDNLAGVLKAEGDLAGARTRYEQAVAVVEAALGPTHPTVAGTLTKLAIVLRAEGDIAQARAGFERALAIFRHRDSTTDAATVLGELTNLEVAVGNVEASVVWLRLQLNLLQLRPPSHAEAVCFFRLGWSAAIAGRPEAGLRLLAACSAVEKRTGNPGAEASDQKVIRIPAWARGYGEERLEEVLAEVEAAYASDRGRGLVEATFPEPEPGGHAVEDARPE